MNSFQAAPVTRKPPKPAGFTLVELLVVIAIIGVLVGLLLPAVQAAREAARRMQCSNNLKQIGLAMHNYHDSQRAFPFGWMLDPTNFNVSSWGIQILPFLEQAALADQWTSTSPAFNEADQLGHPAAVVAKNLQVIATPLQVFRCPSAPGENVHDYTLPGSQAGTPFDLTWTAARSDYTAVSGIRGVYADIAYAGNAGGSRGGLMAGDTKNSFRDITDGTSNTIMVGERVGGNRVYRRTQVNAADTALFGGSQGGGWGDFLNGEHWPKGSLRDGSGDGGPCIINCTNSRSVGFMSFHPGGAHFALCDGSVRFVPENIEAQTFAALVTIGKGEVVGEL